MSRAQTRRSISVRGQTYDALREACDRLDVSMSDVVEQCLAEWFKREGVVPEVSEGRRKGRAPRRPDAKTVLSPEASAMQHSPEEWADVIARYPIPSGDERTIAPQQLEPRRAAIPRRPNYFGAF